MITIEKKIKDIYFNQIVKGEKKLEYRLADFGLGTDYKFVIINEEKPDLKIAFYIKDFKYITGEELEKGVYHYSGYDNLINILNQFHDKVLIYKYGAYIIEIPEKDKHL